MVLGWEEGCGDDVVEELGLAGACGCAGDFDDGWSGLGQWLWWSVRIGRPGVRLRSDLASWFRGMEYGDEAVQCGNTNMVLILRCIEGSEGVEKLESVSMWMPVWW